MNDTYAGELDRKDLDDISRRNNKRDSYKNRYFDGKRSATDEYSGDKIYYSYKGKDNIHGDRHYTTEKTANVDHIKPIDKLKEQYAKDVASGKITKQQLKDIANSDYNLAVTSESRNKAKGGDSNFEYLKKQFEKGEAEDFNTAFTMIQKQIQSDTAVAFNVTGCKVDNFLSNNLNLNPEVLNELTKQTSNAVSSGTGAAFMSMTVSTVNNIVLMATEKKGVKEAVSDIIEDTGNSFVSAAGIDLLQSSLKKSADLVSNESVKKFLSKDIPIQDISSMIMVGDSVLRFINDDITAEECVTEIVLNGVGSIAYVLGETLGGSAGAILSTVVVGKISKCVIEYQEKTKIQRKKDNRFNEITAAALIEMEEQRQELQELIDTKNNSFLEHVTEGYKTIMLSTLNEDVEGLAKGLDEILSVVQKEVKFKSIQQFDNFFFDDSAEFTF